jgi:hypothetical protein
MLFFLAFLLSFNVGVHGTKAMPAGADSPAFSETAPEIVLHMKSPLVSGNSVKLGYEIPYPGYIEFHLFKADGEKIWQNFGVREKGEHYQAVRRDKLNSGETYHYEFWYKGKPYKGKFSN